MELKNRRIELTIGRSMELPHNHSWIKVNVGLAADILDSENIDEAFIELTKQVMRQIFVQESALKSVL